MADQSCVAVALVVQPLQLVTVVDLADETRVLRRHVDLVQTDIPFQGNTEDFTQIARQPVLDLEHHHLAPQSALFITVQYGWQRVERKDFINRRLRHLFPPFLRWEGHNQ